VDVHGGRNRSVKSEEQFPSQVRLVMRKVDRQRDSMLFHAAHPA